MTQKCPKHKHNMTKSFVQVACVRIIGILVVLHVDTSRSQSDGLCNAAADTCPWQGDGECDSELGIGHAPCVGGDCLDCDACQAFKDNCSTCVANGCYWCPGDATCLSTTGYDFKQITSCVAESDYVQTCPTDDGNFFR